MISLLRIGSRGRTPVDRQIGLACGTWESKATVKPWVERVLWDIGPFLTRLSGPEKEVLFHVIRNNVHRIDQWESMGNFRSLDALQAKIEDWNVRGLGPYAHLSTN